MLKYLIPFTSFTIHASLSSIDALAALQAIVEPKKFRLFDRGEKPFEGTAESGRFTIRRLIRYRNSFLPVVSGVIQPAPGGSTIRITMRPMIFVMIFCVFWLSGVLSIGGVLLSQLSWSNIQANPMGLIPVGMVVFFLILVNGGFWFEANKQRKMLTNVFNGIALKVE